MKKLSANYSKDNPSKKLLERIKQHKWLAILIAAVLLIVLVMLPILCFKGEGGDVCSRALEEGDYSTFYREACPINSKYSKDDFIKACEESGKKFYNNPSSSSDECVSEDRYNELTNADNHKETQKQTEPEESRSETQEKEQSTSSTDKDTAMEEKPKESEPTPSPTPADTTPSIDTIADACWAYGQSQGVHLTDYASTNISKDGNYYQILMWHDDGSVWKCWYNPSNKDVFIEKTKK